MTPFSSHFAACSTEMCSVLPAKTSLADNGVRLLGTNVGDWNNECFVDDCDGVVS